jgi:hypothetical protein
MKRFTLSFIFVFGIISTVSAQVSFQYETRSFTKLGFTTNEQIAKYLKIELSDLLPISQNSSMRGQLASISPADFYNTISDAFRSIEIAPLLRISKELGVKFDRLMTVFAREMGNISEADLQMVLAMYRIAVKWDIISP